MLGLTSGQVLTSMANVLNELPGETNLTRTQYMELLVQYAQQHTKTYAVNDTAHPAGSGHSELPTCIIE